MKIGVISDTHGSTKWCRKALDYLKDCDFIVHLGDVLYHGPRNPLPEGYNPAKLVELLNKISGKKLKMVRGNCDADVDLMVLKHNLSLRFRTLKAGSLLLGLIHGDQFSSKAELLDFARKFKLNILLYGHTHKKLLEFREGVVLFNPGSLSLPKDGSKSLGVLEMEGRKARVVLYDLEKEQVILEEEYDFSPYL